MAYQDLVVGPLLVDNSGGQFPANLTVTLSHSANGQTRLSGRWIGAPWHDATGQLVIRAAQVGTGPSLEVDKAYITDRQWKMDPSGGPQGTVEFMCLESKVRVRQPEPNKPGTFVAFLTGLNFWTVNVDPVVLNIGGRQWTLTLLEPMLATREHLKGAEGERITATLSTQIGAPVEIQQALIDEASEIAWVLSFAQGRGVRIARLDTWTNDGWLIDTLLWSGESHGGAPSGPLPLDDVQIGNVVASYVGIAVPRLHQHAEPLRLRALISLSLLARRSQPTEAIALMCANLLEILRHNFAHNVLVPAGRARVDTRGDVLWPAGQNGGGRMSFSEIINAFAVDFGLSGWDKKFKDLRNTVVHTGEVPGNTPMERWRNAMELLHFCDRALLAILGVEQTGARYYQVGANSYATFAL
jgi:hypothetical protein